MVIGRSRSGRGSSDESVFSLHQVDGRVRALCQKHEAIDYSCLASVVRAVDRLYCVGMLLLTRKWTDILSLWEVVKWALFIVVTTSTSIDRIILLSVFIVEFCIPPPRRHEPDYKHAYVDQAKKQKHRANAKLFRSSSSQETASRRRKWRMPSLPPSIRRVGPSGAAPGMPVPVAPNAPAALSSWHPGARKQSLKGGASAPVTRHSPKLHPRAESVSFAGYATRIHPGSDHRGIDLRRTKQVPRDQGRLGICNTISPGLSEEICTAFNIEVLRADEGETRVSTEQCSNKGAGETGYLRENSPTSAIVWHVSLLRKSWSDPAGNRTRFALVGGERSSRFATAPSFTHKDGNNFLPAIALSWNRRRLSVVTNSAERHAKLHLDVLISAWVHRHTDLQTHYSHPTKANRVRLPAGSVSALAFRRCSISHLTSPSMLKAAQISSLHFSSVDCCLPPSRNTGPSHRHVWEVALESTAKTAVAPGWLKRNNVLVRNAIASSRVSNVRTFCRVKNCPLGRVLLGVRAVGPRRAPSLPPSLSLSHDSPSSRESREMPTRGQRPRRSAASPARVGACVVAISEFTFSSNYCDDCLGLSMRVEWSGRLSGMTRGSGGRSHASNLVKDECRRHRLKMRYADFHCVCMPSPLTRWRTIPNKHEKYGPESGRKKLADKLRPYDVGPLSYAGSGPMEIWLTQTFEFYPIFLYRQRKSGWSRCLGLKQLRLAPSELGSWVPSVVLGESRTPAVL
ncbi:hypothetical protein PR048_001282 [Dryococelus australis]|uniref:Uncharacterized protein n=1 Tax=Dryococelus australis TaxID=614101 RepID=A0ABQ9IHW6_9NEOP|nr:hypothetical protein PR048_001282 [Dryococelus australis]